MRPVTDAERALISLVWSMREADRKLRAYATESNDKRLIKLIDEYVTRTLLYPDTDVGRRPPEKPFDADSTWLRDRRSYQRAGPIEALSFPGYVRLGVCVDTEIFRGGCCCHER